jgi:hypothetical protein
MELEAGGPGSGRRRRTYRPGSRRGTSARLLMHALAGLSFFLIMLAGLSGEGDGEAPPSPPWGSARFGAERQEHDEGNGMAAQVTKLRACQPPLAGSFRAV